MQLRSISVNVASCDTILLLAFHHLIIGLGEIIVAVEDAVLAIQDAKELNRTSPGVIVSAVDLIITITLLGNGTSQLVILLNCHVVGRVSNSRLVKDILIVIENPEVTSEGELIKLSVNRHLIGHALVYGQINIVLLNSLLQGLKHALGHKSRISGHILDRHDIQITSGSGEFR